MGERRPLAEWVTKPIEIRATYKRRELRAIVHQGRRGPAARPRVRHAVGGGEVHRAAAVQRMDLLEVRGRAGDVGGAVGVEKEVGQLGQPVACESSVDGPRSESARAPAPVSLSVDALSGTIDDGAFRGPFPQSPGRPRAAVPLFRGDSTISLMEQVRQLRSWDGTDDASHLYRGLACSGLKNLIAQFKSLGMSKSLTAAYRLLNDIEVFGPENFQSVNLRNEAEALEVVAKSELAAVHFLVVHPDRVALFEASAPFGSAVHERMPSCRHDIEEAAKCLALQRYTAAVSHLMRCAEVAARILAQHLRVRAKDLETATMGVTLSRIREAIGDRMKLGSKRKTRKWVSDSEFYSLAALQLAEVERSWRHAVAHARRDYSSEDSVRVYELVRGLMQHLATRLKERRRTRSRRTFDTPAQ